MMPPLRLRLTLLGLAIVAGLAGVGAHGRWQRSRVFTVDELTTVLTRDPGAWLGRTVLVRGVAVTTACAIPTRWPRATRWT
jgi:hypothetical protein